MLQLFNTLSRKKEAIGSPSTSLRANKINLFVCGITPYDYPHIGNARTYVAFDALVRYLRSRGLKVFYLQNVTDIDDKIILRAKKEGKNFKEVARRFERVYLRNMKALGVKSVTKYARATEYIKEIIGQVKRLEKKGYAYEIPGDGIYYDISKFKEYGKLSGRTSLQAEDAVSRIDDSLQKRNKGDFALWKYSKPGEPKWPFGSRGSLRTGLPAGRPGWHIEDTAITEKHFGPQYDLHGGARDLIFPHHEAEIAQMEAISGKSPLARHWVHSGFLTVQGEKMSKSLGNFVTIQDFLKTHSARVLRLLVLKTHWRSPIDYSEKLLAQTESELRRIDEFVERLHETRNMKRETPKSAGFRLQVSGFRKALEDDFNTPKALAVLFDLVTKGNHALDINRLSHKDAKAMLGFLREAHAIFGFIFSTKKKTLIPAVVLGLAKEREKYRKKKQWQKADEVRTLISKKGWQIEDTEKGPKLKKI